MLDLIGDAANKKLIPSDSPFASINAVVFRHECRSVPNLVGYNAGLLPAEDFEPALGDTLFTQLTRLTASLIATVGVSRCLHQLN